MLLIILLLTVRGDSVEVPNVAAPPVDVFSDVCAVVESYLNLIARDLLFRERAVLVHDISATIITIVLKSGLRRVDGLKARFPADCGDLLVLISSADQLLVGHTENFASSNHISLSFGEALMIKCKAWSGFRGDVVCCGTLIILILFVGAGNAGRLCRVDIVKTPLHTLFVWAVIDVGLLVRRHEQRFAGALTA